MPPLAARPSRFEAGLMCPDHFLKGWSTVKGQWATLSSAAKAPARHLDSLPCLPVEIRVGSDGEGAGFLGLLCHPARAKTRARRRLQWDTRGEWAGGRNCSESF